MRNGQASRHLEQVRKRRETKPSPIGNKHAESHGADNETGVGHPSGSATQAIEKEWHPAEGRHHRIERFYWGLSAILTFLAVAGAIATVIISNLTLQEAQKATGEAKRQADAAWQSLPRSYLVAEGAGYSASSVTGFPDFDPGGRVRVSLTWFVKNYGTPLGVLDQVIARVYTGPFGEPSPDPLAADISNREGTLFAELYYPITSLLPDKKDIEHNLNGTLRPPIFITDKSIPIEGVFYFNNIPPWKPGTPHRSVWLLVILRYHEITGVKHVTSTYSSIFANSPEPADRRQYTCWDEQCDSWINKPLP